MAKKLIEEKINRLSEIFGLDLPYFVSGGFWLTSATITSFIGGIILSVLFARIWPKDVFGQFSFLMSALGFMSLTALPGMSQAVVQAASEKKDGVYKQAIEVVGRWSLAGAVFLILGSVYFYLRNNPNLALAVLLSALAFPLTSAYGLYNPLLTGKKQFRKVAIFGTIAQFASIGATALALWQFPNLAVVALFSAWSTAIFNIILTKLSEKEVENNNKDEGLIKLGIHLSFSQIFTISADYLDRFLVPILLGFTNNAIYAFAILIPMQLHTFFKTFLTLGQPKIAQLSERNLRADLIKKSLQLELLIGSVTIVYILSAPFIFHYLYPAYQDSAVRLSQIFSLSLLYFPSNLFGLGLVKKRATKAIYKVNIVYALITILSLIILIPIFGLIGAIVARIIIRSTQAIAQIYFLGRVPLSDNRKHFF